MAKLAVCVGINNYPGNGNDLFGCINDAEDWSVELTKRGFEVAKLLDEKATRSAIKKALVKAVKKAQANDTVVFTYSGTGVGNPTKMATKRMAVMKVGAPMISTQSVCCWMTTCIAYSPKRRRMCVLIMISDSCHSGTVTRMAPPAANVQVPRIRFLPPERFLTRSEMEIADRQAGVPVGLQTKPDRVLLMSGCQDYEYSYDADFGGRPNGAFTYFALQTLKKLKASATYLDWHKAIRKALPSQSHPQSPNLLGAATQKKWKVLGA